MYMMNLEEDDSIDDKMNTTNDGNENNSKGDNENIDFTYRGVSRYLVCRRIDFRLSPIVFFVYLVHTALCSGISSSWLYVLPAAVVASTEWSSRTKRARSLKKKQKKKQPMLLFRKQLE